MKMKIMFSELSIGDVFSDGEIVEGVWSGNGTTYLIFESGKPFAIGSEMMITITRQ